MELARLVTEQAKDPAELPRERENASGPSTTINAAIERWKRNGWQDLSPSTTRRYSSIWTGGRGLSAPLQHGSLRAPLGLGTDEIGSDEIRTTTGSGAPNITHVIAHRG
jgi:hypothetical protein